MQGINEDIVKQCTREVHKKKASPFQANNQEWLKENGYIKDRDQPERKKLSQKEKDTIKAAKLNWRADMRAQDSSFKTKQKKYDTVLKSR